jgi:hypothetical protein
LLLAFCVTTHALAPVAGFGWLIVNRTGFLGGLIREKMEPMGRPSKYAPELRERAVRMVQEHASEHPSQWAAVRSVAEKLGCSTDERRVRAFLAEVDAAFARVPRGLVLVRKR